MELRENRGVTGSVLKWVAIITMLIDHTAVVLVYGLAKYNHAWGAGLLSKGGYFFLRGVGRLGFPLFCFLLAEGFSHTRNRWKYLLRLALFALISEIPFDLAFWDTGDTIGRSGMSFPAFIGLEFSHQNVFFTLALGLTAIMAWEALTNSADLGKRILGVFAGSVCVVLCASAAAFLKTDYGAMGVLLILLMHLLRDTPWKRDLAAFGVLAAMVLFASSHWIELFGALAFPLFHLYNGRRGRQSKYFFYIFYPAHLLLLFLMARLLF